MPTYTVEAIQGEPREWEGKFGKNLSYTLALKDVDGVVELSQKPETPAPTVGLEIEGDIQPSNGNFPPRLKRVQRGGSWGGSNGGGMSPEREKRITRLHSQEMAIRVLDSRGRLADPQATAEHVQRWISEWADFFDKDAGL